MLTHQTELTLFDRKPDTIIIPRTPEGIDRINEKLERIRLHFLRNPKTPKIRDVGMQNEPT
jgi:hypothetical protein